MQLTYYTDYSLRVLIFLGAKESFSSVKEICENYQVSRNHMVKVVHNLSLLGYLDTKKGKGGGISLALSPQDINIGELVEKTEQFQIVECFKENGQCKIAPVCQLRGILYEAQQNFLQTLKKYTLEDIITNKDQIKSFFI